MKPTPQPPQRVPVLTEVVVLPKTSAVVLDDEFPPIPELLGDPAFAATAPVPIGPAEIPRAVSAPVAQQTPPPAPAVPSAAPAPVAPMAAAPEPVVDEARIAQRVLSDLDRQLDLMFEHRLRESLTPVLARMTDSLVREMRNQLAASMRDMVARAVSQELDRLQKR